MGEEQCKGLFARFRRSSYWSGDRLERKETLSILKRSSCKGCPRCGAIEDTLREDATNFDRFPDVSDIKDGDKVRLYIQVHSRDWETGHADDWGVEVEKAHG